MSKIFLGRPWHWAIVAVVIALGWAAGDVRLHVIHFNTFIVTLGLCTVLILALLVATSRPDQQITRDPIEENEDNDPA